MGSLEGAVPFGPASIAVAACVLARMCRLWAAVGLLAFLTGLPHGAAHDWYHGMQSPSGIACCNDRDCRPVPYRLNARDQREEIEANGRWWPVEYDKVLTLPTPDGEAHACWRNPRGRPQFRCIILPGMAGLAPLQPPAAIASASLPARAQAAGR